MTAQNQNAQDEAFARTLLDGILDKGWKLHTVVAKLQARDAARAIPHEVAVPPKPVEAAPSPPTMEAKSDLSAADRALAMRHA